MFHIPPLHIKSDNQVEFQQIYEIPFSIYEILSGNY